MADAKKPAGKPAGKPAAPAAPKPPSLESQIVTFIGLGVLIFLVVLPTVLMFFGTSSGDLLPDNIGVAVSGFFSSLVDTLSFISIFISLILAMGYYYAKVRGSEINAEYEQRMLDMHQPKTDPHIMMQRPASSQISKPSMAMGGINLPGAEESVPAEMQPHELNPKWLDIERHMASSNPNDWKVAVLEADIMLHDMLSQMGYDGTSIGEMLKQVDRASFLNLDEAWKAHRFRNIIAHEGASYNMRREEADNAIRSFKRVFEEFYFI